MSFLHRSFNNLNSIYFHSLTTYLQEGLALGYDMGRKVMLVRGGTLGPNSGIGGAHHALVETLAAGNVSGWSLHGVEEYHLGARPSAFRRVSQRWFSHPRRIQRLSKNQTSVDLIHITDQEHAHLVPRNSAIPTVVTVHDLFHLFPEVKTFGQSKVEIGQSRPSLVRRRDLRKLREGLARADLLLCDSKSTLAACKMHFPNINAVWLPLGLSMERFDPSQANQASASPPAQHLRRACHLLIVGSHDPRKRMDFLFKVLGSLHAEVKQELHIHHVGNPNSPTGAPSIVELATAHSIPHFTAHGGDLSDTALMDMRFASEALLFPSISEGFGYPPIEAMATGTPVLCSNEASHNELMPEGSCLPADDAEAWRAALLGVHQGWKQRTSSDEIHRWPDANKALVTHAHSFDMKAYNQRTCDAYNSLF